MEQQDTESGGFSSLLGFLLSIIGFAVGVGSMWRFPYVTGSNGGALFILTYVVVIVLIGIPLLTAEIAIGYAAQKTPVHAYRQLVPGKAWPLAGWLHVLVALLVFCYTLPIYAWILAYIWRTGTAFFSGMLPDQVQQSFVALTTDYKTLFAFAALNLALIAMAVKNGLEKGIERLNAILLPLLALIMVVCIVIGLQYDTERKGLAYLFQPDWSQFSIQSVQAAVGQAFFAIGIGMLASMVFGSYIKRKDANILRDSSIISGAIVLAGIAAGLMIFPVVFAFDLQPSAGAGLTMITLPNVFNHMAAGRWVGALFYIGFYFAAFTSAIGICEALVAVLMDALGIARKRALALLLLCAVFIGGCSIAVEGFLDVVDGLTSNYLLVASGFAIAIFAGWVWGVDNTLDAANVRHPVLRGWLKVSIQYICPLAIVVIFLGNFV